MSSRTSRAVVALAAVVFVAAGTAAGTGLVPVAGSFVGSLVGAFLLGFAVESRPVLEAAVAAVLARIGLVAAGSLVGTDLAGGLGALGMIDPTTLVVPVAVSALVGALGAHFGDDLRDGLTTPVETATPTGSRSATTTRHESESDEVGVSAADDSLRADDDTVRADEPTHDSLGAADGRAASEDDASDERSDTELEREE